MVTASNNDSLGGPKEPPNLNVCGIQQGIWVDYGPVIVVSKWTEVRDHANLKVWPDFLDDINKPSKYRSIA